MRYAASPAFPIAPALRLGYYTTRLKQKERTSRTLTRTIIRTTLHSAAAQVGAGWLRPVPGRRRGGTMSTSGPAFYDDEAVFATYMAARQRGDNPNDTLEQPVTLELAGDLAGRRVLD